MGIGPSTKETSLHHFRDPLVDIVGSDEGIDLMQMITWIRFETVPVRQSWQSVCVPMALSSVPMAGETAMWTT